MNADHLTPAEKEEVQLYFLRAWLCRKRRKAFAEARAAAIVPRHENKAVRPRGSWSHRRRAERVLAGDDQSTK